MSYSNDVVHDQLIAYWVANGQLTDDDLDGWDDGLEAWSDLNAQAANWGHTGPGLITEA